MLHGETRPRGLCWKLPLQLVWPSGWGPLDAAPAGLRVAGPRSVAALLGANPSVLLTFLGPALPSTCSHTAGTPAPVHFL